MNNRETFEYRPMAPDDYETYDANARLLLGEVAEWADTMPVFLNPSDIISYMTHTYGIRFVGFTVVPERFNGIRSSSAAKYPVDFDKIVLVDSAFQRAVDGFTAELYGNFVVFLNIDLDNPRRGLFTLLHEMVHIRFHLVEPRYYFMCAKLAPDQEYPEELLPYEDEANAIASVLLINDDQLLEELSAGNSFGAVADAYHMSHSALHNRLKNFLAYTVEAANPLGLVCGYRYQQNVSKLQEVLLNWASLEIPF